MDALAVKDVAVLVEVISGHSSATLREESITTIVDAENILI